jgi:putative NIF3 family GTP cyclohydrolase 1 type 2
MRRVHVDLAAQLETFVRQIDAFRDVRDDAGIRGHVLPGQAIAAGADCYVTGEMAYHKGLDAADNGLCVLEAGHAATERPGILALSAALQKASDDVQYNVRVLNSEARMYL